MKITVKTEETELENERFKRAYAEGEAERLAEELGRVMGYVRKHLLYKNEEFSDITILHHAEQTLAEFRDKWGCSKV
jgi:hypothetical protein